LEFVTETLLEAALSLCKSLVNDVTLKVCLITAGKAGLTTSVMTRLDEEEGESMMGGKKVLSMT
jgi:hypothetical protein